MKFPAAILILSVSAAVVTSSKAPQYPNKTSPIVQNGHQRHGAYPSLLSQDAVGNADKHVGIDNNQEPCNICHIFDPSVGGRSMQRYIMGNENEALLSSETALAKSLEKMIDKGEKLAATIKWADEAADEAAAAIAEAEKAILKVIAELEKEANKTTAK